VTGTLFAQLEGSDGRVFSSDLRVRVLATGLATYPDVTVVCGDLEHDPESQVTITNPTLVVEILSPSTEDYDRGDKLEHYRQIPSLRECVLVAQDRRRIEVWRRGAGGGWTHRAAEAGEVDLATIGCRLEIEALYNRAGA
jgi:Uma2 family endonuclease